MYKVFKKMIKRNILRVAHKILSFTGKLNARFLWACQRRLDAHHDSIPRQLTEKEFEVLIESLIVRGDYKGAYDRFESFENKAFFQSKLVQKLAFKLGFVSDEGQLLRRESIKFLKSTRFGDVTGKRILFAAGSGLGNVIQNTAVMDFLHIKYGCKVDIFLDKELSYMASVLERLEFKPRVYLDRTEISESYDLAIFSSFSNQKNCNVNCEFHLQLDILYPAFIHVRTSSETEYHFWALRELGIIGNYSVNELQKKYTKKWSHENCHKELIIFHAGSKSGFWLKKRWPYFAELASILKSSGFRVASVGHPTEYVQGTLDFTGVPLLSTVEHLVSARLVVSNDSGVMHLADAIQVPVLGIFGPSSVIKNKLHGKRSKMINNTSVCLPCQFTDRIRECSNNICLSAITPEAVVKQMHHLIELTVQD